MITSRLTLRLEHLKIRMHSVTISVLRNLDVFEKDIIDHTKDSSTCDYWNLYDLAEDYQSLITPGKENHKEIMINMVPISLFDHQPNVILFLILFGSKFLKTTGYFQIG